MKTEKTQTFCEIDGCKKDAINKILIQDYGEKGKWEADVCQEHYDSAHPSRKQ